eukprot:13524910-Alexandrium_andersonii.AAC.1
MAHHRGNPHTGQRSETSHAVAKYVDGSGMLARCVAVQGSATCHVVDSFLHISHVLAMGVHL